MTFAGLWLKNYSVEDLRKHLCCYWLLKFCDTCTRKFESRKTQMESGTENLQKKENLCLSIEIRQRIPKVSPCHRHRPPKKRPSDTITQTPLKFSKTRGNSLRHPVSASPTQPKPKSPNVLPSSETKCTRFTAKSAPLSVVRSLNFSFVKPDVCKVAPHEAQNTSLRCQSPQKRVQNSIPQPPKQRESLHPALDKGRVTCVVWCMYVLCRMFGWFFGFFLFFLVCLFS